MSNFIVTQGRRARRRRDGRADRRALRERQRAGRPLRPAGQGRPEERHRAQGDREPQEAQPGAARRQGRRSVHPGRQLRGEPRAAQRLRPDHRGDRRTHGLETRPVQEGRAVRRADDAIFASNTSGLPITKLSEAHGCGPEGTLLRRALLQPAALHAPGRADPDAGDRPQILDDLETFLTDARQGRGARQGHAELHRQPRRHLRHAGDDQGSREVRPGLRRRRRPDRPQARPRQVRDLPYRGRRRPRHDGARDQDHAGHAARIDRSVCRAFRHAGRAARRWSTRARSARRAGAGFYRKDGKNIMVLDPKKAGLRRRRAARPTN